MAQEKSVYEVMSSAESYFMPDYQRGYKWIVSEVRKLLDDVSAFQPGNNQRYYCLQNITLKESESGRVPHGYNVIDGQQRLTTSIVIISFFRDLRNEDLDIPDLTGKLTYGVRDVTDRFLQEEIVTRRIWEETDPAVLDAPVWSVRMCEQERAGALRRLFDDRIRQWEDSGRRDRNHQDIFHLYCAAMEVAAYFRSEESAARRKFASKYLNDVKFIENKVGGIDEAVIFSKINGFRVPLDGADLLRGIFVTDVSRGKIGDFMGETERNVLLGEYRVKAGLELDLMNAWWCDDSHRRYFGLFDSIRDPDGIFDVRKYPINLLYRLYEQSLGRDEILLEHFENPPEGAPRQFEAIKQFHKIMQDWYEDRRIYHFAGFLMSLDRKHMPVKFADIFGLWKNSLNRTQFIRELKRVMFKRTLRDGNALASEEETDSGRMEEWKNRIVRSREYNWYESDTDVKRFLVLLDVIAHSAENAEAEVRNVMAEHMDPSFFGTDGEDKEHIFPQTPIADEDLRGNREGLREKIGRYWRLILDTAMEKRSVEDEGELLTRWQTHWGQGPDAALAAETPFPITGITDEWFDRLVRDESGVRDAVKERINSFVMSVCETDINSIGNIVLLRAATNRSYGNDFYVEKRQRVLSDFRSSRSIRIHTRSVFAKEFPLAQGEGGAEEFDVWGQKSIVMNRQDIAKQISGFFAEVVHG